RRQSRRRRVRRCRPLRPRRSGAGPPPPRTGVEERGDLEPLVLVLFLPVLLRANLILDREDVRQRRHVRHEP
ncbi:unnamed protein product, partial [Ectocarpus sp. 6 AP-2014]